VNFSSWLRTPSFFAVATCAALLPACQPPLIPNTDVEDTDDNRRVIEFCETYRKAVERRDIPRLMKMAHADYYENGGTIDTSDDMDRQQLEEYLETKFSDTRGIRYEIRYRRIGAGRHDVVYVDYTFSELQGQDGRGDGLASQRRRQPARARPAR
jgi:hypothetical protein